MNTKAKQWHKIDTGNQEPIPFNPVIFRYGIWKLGFEWVRVTLGASRPILGLGLYIQKRDENRKVYLTFNLPEAVAFAERCKLGPKRFVQLMECALKHASDRTYSKEELKPWLIPQEHAAEQEGK